MLAAASLRTLGTQEPRQDQLQVDGWYDKPFTGYQPYAHSGRTVVPSGTSFSSASRSSCPSTSHRPALNGGGLIAKRCRRRTSRAATTQALPLRRTQLLPRRSVTRLDLQRAVAAVRSRTEDLEVERLHIASRWSIKLVPSGEVPTDRRRQDHIELYDLVPLEVTATVAGARRARPRGRMG